MIVWLSPPDKNEMLAALRSLKCFNSDLTSNGAFNVEGSLLAAIYSDEALIYHAEAGIVNCLHQIKGILSDYDSISQAKYHYASDWSASLLDDLFAGTTRMIPKDFEFWLEIYEEWQSRLKSAPPSQPLPAETNSMSAAGQTEARHS